MMKRYASGFGLLCVTLTSAALVAPVAAYAETDPALNFDIGPTDLSSALRIVARQAGREIIIVDADVAGKSAPALVGSYSLQDALNRILAGSGVHFTIRYGAILISAPGTSEETIGDSAIIVTGSRVRGAPSASALLRITQADIAASGYSDLGEVARSLPQSSGGGQNPGVGLNAASGENTNGGSSFDLRGIGADATLTLLNGHRLSYSAANQSIDVAAIPVAAVDAVEIVPDGASAIYGSDAVGGVVNIRLKQGFKGLSTSARVGGATSGGDTEQQYSAVAGSEWGSGSLLMTGNYQHDTSIRARHRTYITSMAPATTVLPGQKQFGFLASGKQSITDSLSFMFDALYNNRKSGSDFVTGMSDTPATNSILQRMASQSGAFAPRLSLQLGNAWSAAVSGVVAFDHSRYTVRRIRRSAVTSDYDGCYCNAEKSLEASFEGSLLTLPGGDARAAFGAGYRNDRMHARREGLFDYVASRASYYGYGELYLPFVGADNAMPLIQKFSATAAVRYEHYRTSGGIATPKLGIIYAPIADVTLKASWGKSFKAATLFQSYSPVYAYLSDASDLGCTACGPGATGLELAGGNTMLKPERATNWSVTLDLQPSFADGLNLEVSYFEISYRNRVISPLPSSSQAFNPLYARFLDTNITANKLANAIAGAADFQNFSSADDYDPSAVVAIVDERFTNAARQSVSGVDVQAHYSVVFTEDTKLNASLAGTYLRSDQQLIAGSEISDLAGTLYNPPHFRARGGFTLTHGQANVSGFINRIGGVQLTDGEGEKLRGMTTFDMTASLAMKDGTGPLSGTTFSLSILNLFNRKPAFFDTGSPIVLPFDGTNYSGVGRFAALTIARQW